MPPKDSEPRLKTLAVETRVRTELIRIAYREAPLGLFMAATVSSCVTFIAYSHERSTWLFIWLALSLLMVAVRGVTVWSYFRNPRTEEENSKWENRFAIGTFFSGAILGFIGWQLFPSAPAELRALVSVVIAGMTAGAARVFSPIPKAYVFYLYLAMAPLAARSFLEGGMPNMILGLVFLMFVTYMTVTARQYHNTLRRSLALSFENKSLVETLIEEKTRVDGLNTNLTEEISRRMRTESDLRVAKERAVAANHAKTEFLATMSHEIRTPMNGVIGMLQLVRDSEPLTEEQKSYIDTASSSADVLLALLSDLLDYTKIETGRFKFESIEFNLPTAIEDTFQLLCTRAREKSIECTLSLASDLPDRVVGDPTRIKQVLVNILGNAVKFTDKGTIRMSVWAEQSLPDTATIRFQIADSGIGMSEETLAKIFSAFTQGDGSTSRRHGGTGLGLAISQRLVLGMGGRPIKVQSQPGHGSMFSFQINVRIATESSTPESRPMTVIKRAELSGRVLVVEDDPANQGTILAMLSRMGIEGVLSENARDAIDRIRNGEAFDLILMDYQLPGMDGLEATRQIRRILGNKSLPIIAVTANARETDKEACLAAGMDDYLAKPIYMNVLREHIERWIGSKARF